MPEKLFILTEVVDNYMSILIGADIVPTKTNCELFDEGNALDLVGRELWMF